MPVTHQRGIVCNSMAIQERLFDTAYERQRTVDISQDEKRRVVAKESECYSYISLAKGDVLLYRASPELTVILLATGEESRNTFQDEYDLPGDTTTTIVTPCRVWLFHENTGTVKETDNGLWRGKECESVCLQLVASDNGLICEKSVQEKIASPPEGTIYTHIKAEDAINLPLDFMQE